MRYTTTFLVHADQGRAFDYVADGRNGLSSHPKGSTMDQVPPGRVGLGTRFEVHRPGGPNYVSTVSLFDRPARLAFQSAFNGESPADATWTFAVEGSRTRVTIDTTTGFVGPRWVKPFVVPLTLAAWPLLLVKMWGIKRRISRELGVEQS